MADPTVTAETIRTNFNELMTLADQWRTTENPDDREQFAPKARVFITEMGAYAQAPPFHARQVPFHQLQRRIQQLGEAIYRGRTVTAESCTPLPETFVAETITETMVADCSQLVQSVRAFAQAMVDGAAAGQSSSRDHQLELELLTIRVEALLSELEGFGNYLRLKGWLRTPVDDRRCALREELGTIRGELRRNTAAGYQELVSWIDQRVAV